MKVLGFILFIALGWQQTSIRNCKVVNVDNNYVSVLLMIKGEPTTIGVIREKECHYSQIKIGDSAWINPSTRHIYKNSQEKPE